MPRGRLIALVLGVLLLATSAAAQDKPRPLTGLWQWGQATVRITEQGDSVFAHYVEPSADDREQRGFAPNDLLFTGTRDGDMVRGRLNRHLHVRFREKCAAIWQTWFNFEFRVSDDGNELRGTVNNANVNDATCQVTGRYTDTTAFQRISPTGEVAVGDIVQKFAPGTQHATQVKNLLAFLKNDATSLTSDLAKAETEEQKTRAAMDSAKADYDGRVAARFRHRKAMFDAELQRLYLEALIAERVAEQGTNAAAVAKARANREGLDVALTEYKVSIPSQWRAQGLTGLRIELDKLKSGAGPVESAARAFFARDEELWRAYRTAQAAHAGALRRALATAGELKALKARIEALDRASSQLRVLGDPFLTALAVSDPNGVVVFRARWIDPVRALQQNDAATERLRRMIRDGEQSLGNLYEEYLGAVREEIAAHKAIPGWIWASAMGQVSLEWADFLWSVKEKGPIPAILDKLVDLGKDGVACILLGEEFGGYEFVDEKEARATWRKQQGWQQAALGEGKEGMKEILKTTGAETAKFAGYNYTKVGRKLGLDLAEYERRVRRWSRGSADYAKELKSFKVRQLLQGAARDYLKGKLKSGWAVWERDAWERLFMAEATRQYLHYLWVTGTRVQAGVEAELARKKGERDELLAEYEREVAPHYQKEALRPMRRDTTYTVTLTFSGASPKSVRMRAAAAPEADAKTPWTFELRPETLPQRVDLVFTLRSL